MFDIEDIAGGLLMFLVVLAMALLCMTVFALICFCVGAFEQALSVIAEWSANG